MTEKRQMLLASINDPSVTMRLDGRSPHRLDRRSATSAEVEEGSARVRCLAPASSLSGAGQNPSSAPSASGFARRHLTEPARSPGVRGYRERGEDWAKPLTPLTWRLSVNLLYETTQSVRRVPSYGSRHGTRRTRRRALVQPGRGGHRHVQLPGTPKAPAASRGTPCADRQA